MKYRVDIYDMHEDYIASEEFSVLESSTPIPIPNVGDRIYVPSGSGPNSKQAKDLKVVERTFTYTPEFQNEDAYSRVELYCELISGS